MKKWAGWLWFILLVSASAVNAADLAVADSNLQECIQKLAKKNKWQTAEDVDEIVCHASKIQSLAGITKFTQVKKLSLHKNQISSVDLTGLVRLEHLNIARNELTELVLEGLPNLQEVYVFGNKLTAFRIANLPQLSLLKGNSNELMQFTYNNVPQLEKIYLFDNKLETIDIYHLPGMNYMDVRQNPMPDELYEEMDAMADVTILHEGNAEDW